MKRITSLNFPASIRPGEKTQSKTGISPLGPVVLDDFGFDHVIFRDSYERTCVVGHSSVAVFEPPGSSALWIGLVDVTRENQKAAMHLSFVQVRDLVATLQGWLDRGSIDPSRESRERRRI